MTITKIGVPVWFIQRILYLLHITAIPTTNEWSTRHHKLLFSCIV